MPVFENSEENILVSSGFASAWVASAWVASAWVASAWVASGFASSGFVSSGLASAVVGAAVCPNIEKIPPLLLVVGATSGCNSPHLSFNCVNPSIRDSKFSTFEITLLYVLVN